MHKIRFLFLVFIIATSSCHDGEEGEPGPDGEQGLQGTQGPAGTIATDRLGYFEGTVSGHRTDGTAFNLPFKFEYSNRGWDVFSPQNGRQFLELQRYSSRLLDPLKGSFWIGTELINANTPQETLIINKDYLMFFSWEDYSGDKLFYVNAIPYFTDIPARKLEISIDNNQQYNFKVGNDGNIILSEVVYHNINCFEFHVSAKGIERRIYYREDNGELEGIYDVPSEQDITDITTLELYQSIKFINHPELNWRVFSDQNGNWLHENLPAIPADQATISNYKKDTGIISFDFEVNISQHRRSSSFTGENTTRHDLLIKGKFNSGAKIYDNIVSRTKSE